MKQFVLLLSGILFFFHAADAQYFQGTATKDTTEKNNLKLIFKIKPTGNITTGISYIEAAFRYSTGGVPNFNITNITSNTAVFPGLNVQRFTPDYVANEFTYVKFVFNTATIPSAQYTAGTEYQLFTITTSLPASATPILEMISNLVLRQYQFGVVDGAGNFLDPGTGAQLYGTNFRIAGDDHIVPIPLIAALPVKFNSFHVTKNDKSSLLTWTVENQDANTSYYDIERSLNGIDFTKIGSVRANLISAARATYTFTDPRLNINASVPIIYYRIKQVDADNRYVYTDIQNVVLSSNSLGAVLYPNPVSHNATLSFYLSSPQKIYAAIFNADGQKVQGLEFAGTPGLNQNSINLTSFPAGMYHLIVREGELVKRLKFVKIK